jgi:ribosomal protein S7
LFLDNLRLPFLLRSKRVAGRLYQIPMVTSIDSQYNQVIRNLLKLTKNQKYRAFHSYLISHLKLSYLNQSYLYLNLLNSTTTATDNIRFVRFR